MTEPGGDDERAGGAAFSRLVDDASDGRRWRRYHHEFGNKRQSVGRVTEATPSISA